MRPTSLRSLSRRLSLFALPLTLLAGAALAQVGSGAVALGAGGATQDFDSLAASGESSVLPAGWYFREAGGTTQSTYQADDGNLNQGNVFSFGSSGSNERAFGSLASNSLGAAGTVVAEVGVRINNQTGATLASLPVRYFGELWRLQATGVDALAFEYSSNATSLTTGTWTPLSALDFATPAVAGLGPKDGNLAANRIEISATITGLSVANGGDLWLRWRDTNISGNDNALAIDDVVLGTLTDLPPSVVSSVPTQGATGVAVGAAISLGFSEEVSVDAMGVALLCNMVAQPLTIGGTGATRTLTPNASLPFSANCTLTLSAAAVSDLDAPIDPMAADFVLDFQTGADLPPTLQSTFPVDGAVNVAVGSNLGVTFSEPVSVTPSAFVIQCPSGSAIAHAVSSTNQITWTLDPDANLPIDTDCTLSIVASEIFDLEGTPDQLAAGAVVDFTTSAGLAGYYARVDDSSCRTLRATLHGVIDDHVAVVYSDSGNTWTPGDPSTYDVWEVLNLADEDPLDPARILDIYRNESYTKIAGGTGIYNREHVWPNSHGFNDIQTLDGFPNAPYTDSHMLMASNTVYNSNRGSRAFAACNPGVTPSCTRDDTIFNAANGDGGGPTAHPGAGAPDHNWYSGGVDGGSGSYEAWDFRRGDLARAMLYMDLRYEGGTNSRNGQRETDLILTDVRANIVGTPSGAFQTVGYSGLLTPLLGWAQQDPPTAREGLRNDVVESVQGNRNPFVDHPEWIARAFPAPMPCEGQDVVAVDDDFSVNQGSVLTAAAPGMLRDDHNGNNKNGQGLSASIVTPAQNGSVTITNASTGTFTYTPDPGFCGADQFSYLASNGSDSDFGEAYINVICTGGNLPPVAVNDNYNVIEDASLTVLAPGVLGNDSDPEGNSIIAELVSNVGSGALSFAANGGFIYTPDGNFCGNDAFTYRARDATGSSAVAMATIAVACVNDAPVASNATFALAENSAIATVVGQVVASDVDTADTLAYAITAGNGSGAFSISTSGQITVANATPLDFEATPQFVLTVTVSDNGVPPRSTTATITINLTNVEEGPATAVDDSVGVDEDSIDAVLDVLANDTPDPDGDAFVITGIGTVAHGTVAFDAGEIRYSPAADYCGADSVTYTITGGSSATVAILVACINDAPIAVGTLPDRSAEVAVAIVPFSVAGGFDDPDFGDTLSFSAMALPPGLMLDPDSGMVSGTVLAGGANASPYSVLIRATDDGGLSITQGFEYVVAPSADQIFADGFED